VTYEELEAKWGIEPYCYSGIGGGWVPIVDRLFTALKELGFSDWKSISQIKEKYGGLRVYSDYWLTEAQEALIDAAEEESYKTCEKCGAAGTLRQQGWWKTLCDGCFK